MGMEVKVNSYSPRGQYLAPLCVVTARRSFTASSMKSAVEEASGVPASEQRLFVHGAVGVASAEKCGGNDSCANPCSIELGDGDLLGTHLPEGESVALTLLRRREEHAFWLTKVTQRGAALAAGGALVRRDRAVALAAVRQDSQALQFVADSLKADRQVVLEAVRKDGCALKHAAAKLRDDREVVLAAVNQDGFALSFAGEALRNDTEIVSIASQNNSLALQFASPEIRRAERARAACQGSQDAIGELRLATPRYRWRHKGGNIALNTDFDGRWPAATTWTSFSSLIKPSVLTLDSSRRRRAEYRRQ
eukprot:TRINITY_DN26768_c0_g1_i1.p1 TRINITY_DN26768_c0_g1~~TRINITY_DN26768_c0_g1_i1.p1  ORF type:complete len:307 (-),score=38.06 TRINITY_DN26768_c0_g1_i1:53-973(-)